MRRVLFRSTQFAYSMGDEVTKLMFETQKQHIVNVFKMYLETLWCEDTSLVWDKHVIKET